MWSTVLLSNVLDKGKLIKDSKSTPVADQRNGRRELFHRQRCRLSSFLRKGKIMKDEKATPVVNQRNDKRK